MPTHPIWSSLPFPRSWVEVSLSRFLAGPLPDNVPMTDPESTEDEPLPHELPPVEPPSAGFIMQLFLIPALIIAVIVGIVAAFGLMASSQEDWRKLVQDIRNPNDPVRWRAAMGLAQILPLDEKLGDKGQNLVANREIAESLCGLLDEELKRAAPTEEELQLQIFLARAIQILRVPDIVIPSMIRSVHADHDVEVRKNGLAAIAIFANRANEGGPPLTSEQTEELVAALTEVSMEPKPLMRQMSAFSLGMLNDPSARERLEVLLGDGDLSTRANAMVGLARQNDPSGYPVLEEIFASAFADQTEGEDTFARLAALKNAIAAANLLSPELSDEQRERLIALLKPIAAKHAESRIRVDAKTALKTLGADGTEG